jgi:GR25 family glycosyltransferase involved in LPS biosynthesis
MREPAAYLINLASRPDRLRTATERLSREGFTPEIVVAQTYESARAANIEVAADLRGRYPMTAGDLGCIASHLGVFQLIVERDQPGALIFEDDVLPVTDFSRRSRHAFATAPIGTVLQLGWVGYEHRVRNRLKDLGARASGKLRRDRWELDSFAFGTHCYWASAEFARFALTYLTPAFAPIDLMLAVAVREPGQRNFRWPPLAIQDDSPSDIRERTHGTTQNPKW